MLMMYILYSMVHKLCHFMRGSGSGTAQEVASEQL
jgi:hypothetical protein